MRIILLLAAALALPAMADTRTITCANTIAVTETAAATTYTCPITKVTPPPPGPSSCPNATGPTFPAKSQPQDPITPAGGTTSYILPTADSGRIQVTQYGGGANAAVEIWISACPGALNEPLRNLPTTYTSFGTTKQAWPCKMNYNYTGGSIRWSTTTSTYNVCKIEPGVRYFVNIRHVNFSGTKSCLFPSCRNVLQWNDL